MNEDILLTNKSPEIVKIVQEYWGAPIILDQDDLEIIIEEACQAQLRKVVEFYQQIPVAGRPMHDVWADFLEALREAAGRE